MASSPQPHPLLEEDMPPRHALIPFLLAIPTAAPAAADLPVLTVLTYDSFVSAWGPGPAIEAAFEALIIFIIAFLMPVHAAALTIFAMLSLIYNVYGHLGYEVMPRALARSPIGPWLNKSAYHNNHHRAFRCNYGFYTTIWDRAFGTFDPRSPALYDRATRRA